MKFTILSTTLREHEQKLSAAMPTGTGPDIFDVGTNISVNFAGAGLIAPNPPDIDAFLKSGAYRPESVKVFTIGGKTYGLPLPVQHAGDVLEPRDVQGGRARRGRPRPSPSSWMPRASS